MCHWPTSLGHVISSLDLTPGPPLSFGVAVPWRQWALLLPAGCHLKLSPAVAFCVSCCVPPLQPLSALLVIWPKLRDKGLCQVYLCGFDLWIVSPFAAFVLFFLNPLYIAQIMVLQASIIQQRNDCFPLLIFQLTENSCWAKFGGYQAATVGSQKQPGAGHRRPGDSGTDLTQGFPSLGGDLAKGLLRGWDAHFLHSWLITIILPHRVVLLLI